MNMQAWAERLVKDDKFGEDEQLIHQIAFCEYLSQIHGGIPMSQNEILRPQDIGLSQDDQRALMVPAVAEAGDPADRRVPGGAGVEEEIAYRRYVVAVDDDLDLVVLVLREALVTLEELVDVDGLAGQQTQIIINSLLAVDGTPRLSTAMLAKD